MFIDILKVYKNFMLSKVCVISQFNLHFVHLTAVLGNVQQLE